MRRRICVCRKRFTDVHWHHYRFDVRRRSCHDARLAGREVRARVCQAGNTAKYALFDGKNVYKLSDQVTPAEFAGQKVKVTGTLFTKTGIIQVEKVERLK